MAIGISLLEEAGAHRARAAHIRELARCIPDAPAAERLRDYAAELERRAAELEAWAEAPRAAGKAGGGRISDVTLRLAQLRRLLQR